VESAPSVVRVHRSGPLRGTLVPPSSKYHTLRYLLAALLARGTSHIYAPATSDDSDVLLRACAQLGADISIEQPGVFAIRGTHGKLRQPPGGVIDVGNAGAVLRLLMGICATLPEPVTFTTPFPESLGRRPNADLLDALGQLGAAFESQSEAGTLPVTLSGNEVRGGSVRVSGKRSSQYISALLYLGPLLPEGLDIEIIDGLTSASFIDLTIQVLCEVGIVIHERERHRHYVVPGAQHYQPRAFHVPGDYPSAAALLAAVAVAGGEVTLEHLPEGDREGDYLLNIFAEMGVEITRTGTTIRARVSHPLRGVAFDGSPVIDSVPVIAAAACFAQSPSTIYNVANLRLKESNRIEDLARELNKAGCLVVPTSDSIEIYPVEPGGISGNVDMEGHADHRLIQACAIVGLGSSQPVTIHQALHIAKSYPRFFDDLRHIGARIEYIRDG
jgi:3-phosphoshikimate 1-carboxyvinyltransferase